MEWKECSGVGQIAVPSEEFRSRKEARPMCPVCTKYLSVKIGQIVPYHEAVVINSQPVQQDQRRPST
jgi:hypothetical protein